LYTALPEWAQSLGTVFSGYVDCTELGWNVERPYLRFVVHGIKFVKILF
jgi:hypothetical protein